MIKNTIAIEQIKRPYATPEIMVVEMATKCLLGENDISVDRQEGEDEDYDQ